MKGRLSPHRSGRILSARLIASQSVIRAREWRARESFEDRHCERHGGLVDFSHGSARSLRTDSGGLRSYRCARVSLVAPVTPPSNRREPKRPPPIEAYRWFFALAKARRSKGVVTGTALESLIAARRQPARGQAPKSAAPRRSLGAHCLNLIQATLHSWGPAEWLLTAALGITLIGALVTVACYILASVPLVAPKSMQAVEKEPAVAD